MIQKRDIAMAIIFSILTCGIYAIYWFIVLTEDMNRFAPDDYQMSGGASFLLSFITCGIYGIYWSYKMGEKVDRIKGTSNTGILYIVLHLVGFGIINLALMQDLLNSYASN